MIIKYLSIVLAIFFLAGCQAKPVDLNVNQRIIDLPARGSEIPIKPTSTPMVDSEEVLDAKIKKSEVTEPEIPQTLDYPVAFISQAPYAVWDQLHKEACEEAAMITVAKYFKQEAVTAHTAEQAILNLVKWEQSNNYKIDLTATEARDILVNYFNLKADLVTEVTVEKIKKELATGKLIIIPAAGRQLGNPYFQTPGPIYHMLVIRGYDDQNFITNDVGTKRGDGFKYKYQTLINAIHDWDHGLAKDGMSDEEMNSTPKIMIVVSRGLSM